MGYGLAVMDKKNPGIPGFFYDGVSSLVGGADGRSLLPP